MRWIFFSFIGVLLLVNFIFLYNAADSISNRNEINAIDDICNYLETNRNTVFFLSNRIRRRIFNSDFSRYDNITDKIEMADKVILLSNEPKEEIRVNRIGTYDIVSGSHEVNWDYYATWKGHIKVIAIEKNLAVAYKIR
jgi:hypothetical protein